MQIQCSACGGLFNLDDAKVPKKTFAVPCPKCKGRIVVEIPAPGAAAPAPAAEAPAPPPVPAAPAPVTAAPAPAPAATPAAPGGVSPQDLERLRQELMAEIFRTLGTTPGSSSGASALAGTGGPQQKLALVCEDEAMIQAVIRDTLQSMGFQPVVCGTTAEAVERLSQPGIVYRMVTVDNRFPDEVEGGLKILQTINAKLPDERRKMFVAFVSSDLSTLDGNSAFVLGANMTINKKELKRLQPILEEGLQDHARTFRVVEECADEVARARTA